jgi:hypothetical protein
MRVDDLCSGRRHKIGRLLKTFRPASA